jgi:hypothetical protein
LLFPFPGDGLQGQQHPSWLNPCLAYRVTLVRLFALYQLHFNTGLQMQLHTFVVRSARRGPPSHQSRTCLTYRPRIWTRSRGWQCRGWSRNKGRHVILVRLCFGSVWLDSAKVKSFGSGNVGRHYWF